MKELGITFSRAKKKGLLNGSFLPVEHHFCRNKIITELFVNTLQFLKVLRCNIMKFNCNSLTDKYLRTFHFCLGDSKVHWVRIFWSFIAFSSSSWYFLGTTLPIQNWLIITLWSFASCLQFVFAELTLLLIYRALKQSRGICSSPQSCQNDKTLCIDITVQVLLFWGFASILHGNMEEMNSAFQCHDTYCKHLWKELFYGM